MSYRAIWKGNGVSLFTEPVGSEVILTESAVPADGSVNLRARGKIVGKRVDSLVGWSEDRLAGTFAIAFSRGGAGPIHALRLTCPDDRMLRMRARPAEMLS